MNNESLEDACKKLVSVLNPEWETNPDMKETPLRIAKMYASFFRNEDTTQYFSKRFPTKNKELVILKNIECFGMCPHHLTPVIYNVHIGYIPRGWAIGLSKLARIAIALCSYPKLQENFTSEVANVINDNLKPRGVIVVVEGIHNCIRCRGVEKLSTCITSEIRGVFINHPETKQEFISLISLNNY
ncbi:MAG TPA: GTP cyclohydrolase I [Candidatus Colwellbacteria bacterium]|jgi:GTP cyclohydrolase I|nr:GTP cyclohydrolase I [Candidatus Colwellbacteria bacterium]